MTYEIDDVSTRISLKSLFHLEVPKAFFVFVDIKKVSTTGFSKEKLMLRYYRFCVLRNREG